VTTLVELLDPLRRLQDWMRDLLVSACQQYAPRELSEIVHDGAGDVTFMVDRVGETALVDWLKREIAIHEPIVLVGEGLPNGCITLPESSSADDAQWRLIVDQIDATRGVI